MHFSIPRLTAILAAAVGITSAIPLVDRQTTTVPANWKLQTKVVGAADSGTNKNGLFVYSYHTGAGLGDAALTSNQSVAWTGHLNGTQALFTYPNAQSPWPMAVSYGPYQDWEVVTISSATGYIATQDFFFNETGFQFSQYNETSPGWLACDWWHGVPQLFSLTYGYKVSSYPSSCSLVQLYPVAV